MWLIIIVIEIIVFYKNIGFFIYHSQLGFEEDNTKWKEMKGHYSENTQK